MKSKILFMTMAAALSFSFAGCNESESDLLKSKVYFENNEKRFEVSDQDVMNCPLQTRLSKKADTDVKITYAIGTAKDVDDYNKKNGTEYLAIESSKVSLSTDVAEISKGNIYSQVGTLTVKGLLEAKEGKTYLLPIKITKAQLGIIKGTDIEYYILSKPVRITNAWSLYSNCIKVPLTPSNVFESVTYEALVNLSYFGENNTVMGTEGVLILRIGDSALPGHARDLIQIAGAKQYNSTEKFQTNRWYHVAFTYDKGSGKTAIYINGNKSAEATWDAKGFDISGGPGCFVGKVWQFMWGERPFYGHMSEVRFWNVARTENQIKQNMLNVDPSSEGLAVYYKLNGKDQYQKDGKWYIKDASGHNLDGLCNGDGSSKLKFDKLEQPVDVK